MTPYQKLVDDWKGCTRCPLHKTRCSVVMARGPIPCDIFVCGEAPGKSEDVMGFPFAGPAGHEMDRIIRASVPGHLRVCFGNLVGCIPVDDDGKKQGEPEDESIEACAPRLAKLIRMCNPKLVVRVGKVAKDWLTLGMRHSVKLDKVYEMVDVIHPAAVLRSKAPQVQKDAMINRSIITIIKAVNEHFPEMSRAEN